MRRLVCRARVGPTRYSVAALACSVLAALGVGVVFLALVGYDPFGAYRILFWHSLGTAYGLSESLVKAVPLILTGLGVAVAFRMRLWNIGAEGQLYAGALAATWVALFAPGWVPSRVLTMMGAAILAGGCWAVVPGLLRAWLGVSEILVTLMGNYVAILVADHLCYGPWKGQSTFGFPMSDRFPPDAWLPTYAGTRLHAGLPIALAAALLVWVVLWRTKWGFRVRVAGSSPRTAAYAGYRVRRDAVVVMVLSGALAGLGGGVEMAGVLRRLQPRFSPGYGYMAVLISWLARLHPLAVLPLAIFFAALITGGEHAQVRMGIPAAVVEILQGIILIASLIGDAVVRYRIVLTREERGAGDRGRG